MIDSPAYRAGCARAEAEHQRALDDARTRLAELEAMTEGELFRAGAHADLNRLRWLLEGDD